ncbi:FAD-dependent oxidoreductase [Sphingosinicella sp. LY1275]|uniref:FAD-dependent oxidoreductase n=1 Tax=Sphingosinicella sp. LY1275 TaxID=3095379 RepID=UPI002ADEF536|nr:FAD-dependent oxidoreductase [Sphingosinicella sp. LY1275]MEA1014219.1 FAD-dependent oxidoreductase [Sphingosinicella sp. LY1275]
MNVGDERSTSCWMDSGPTIGAAPLDSDAECDVVVIGSGIAGLSIAYELSRFGRRVIVIDRGRIGWGMTARTTAHLATELDDFYSELIRVRGADEARLYHDSQVAAVNRIEAICRDEGIDADFARVDGYLFPAEAEHRADLEEEYQACQTIGVPVEWADRAPIPGIDTGPALRFPNQGRLHPMKYLAGLASAIVARGGRLHSDTTHVSDEEVDGGVEITTEAGHVIRASAAVFCTNSPTNDKVAIHAKQLPDRTYAIAGRVAKGSVPDALAWDTYEAYHYVRIQPLNDTEDLLIVGGEDHRSGEATDMDERLAALEGWTRERYPSFARADYRWSGQVLEPIDFMPFSGRNPGNTNIYIHTGDSGQGITNGVAGSLTILPLIIGEDSRYAPVFDPARKSAAPTAAKEFLKGQAGAAKNFAEYLTPGQVASADDLAPGEGAVIREGLSKIATYKAEDGTVVRRSAACTHMGCLLHWNGFEKCWDCPCHGSQFAPDGQVLNGPAVKPLAAAEE